MSEVTRVIAEFNTPSEAHAARLHLAEEGIEATVSGDLPNPAGYSWVGRLQYAPIELSVGASDVDRAQEILAHRTEAGELDKGWEAAAEAAVTGWICRGCDTEVPQDQDVCPECGTLRSQQPPEDEAGDEG